MKFVLTFFLLVIISIAFGADTSHIKNIRIIDFLESGLKYIHPDKWEGNERDDYKDIYSCSSRELFPSSERVKLKFKWSVNVPDVEPDVYLQNLDYDNLDFTFFSVKKYPVGANVVLYGVSTRGDHKRVDIFKRDKVPPDGIFFIDSPEIGFRKIKFTFPPGFLEKFSVRYYLYGTYSWSLPNLSQYDLILPSGQFNLVLKYDYNGDKFKAVIPHRVVENQKLDNTVRKIVVREDDFKRMNSKDLEGLEDKSGVEYFEHLSNQGFKDSSDMSQIESIKSIVIKEKKINVRSYFVLSDGKVLFDETKKDSFKDAVKDLPYYTLEFSGKCSKVYRRLNNFRIFEHPSAKSLELGSLEFLKNTKDEVSARFKSNKSSVKKTFTPNFAHTFCSSQYVSLQLHIAKSYVDKWVNLGKGPWGENGWMVAPYYSIFNIKYNMGLNGGWLSFRRDKDGKIFAEGIESSKGEKLTEDVKYEVKPEEFFDENGNPNFYVNCSYTC